MPPTPCSWGCADRRSHVMSSSTFFEGTAKIHMLVLVPVKARTSVRCHKKSFAHLPTALRPSPPAQKWVSHQPELTSLPVLRYSSGHRKGRLKILSVVGARDERRN